MELYLGIGRNPIPGNRLRWVGGALIVTLGGFLLVAGPANAKGLSTTTSVSGEKSEATGCTCGTVKTPKGTGTGHSGGGGVILTGG